MPISAGAIGGQLAPHLLQRHALDNDPTGPGELLQNESFTAEEARAELLHQRDIQLRGALRKQEAVALHQHGFSRRKIEYLDSARIAARESDFTVATDGLEVGQKQRLAHQLAFRRTCYR